MTKTTANRNKGAMYIRDLPAETKHQFKIWCVENSISITDAITVMLTKIVSEPRGKFARDVIADAQEDE